MKFKKFNTMLLTMALAGSLCLTPTAAADFTAEFSDSAEEFVREDVFSEEISVSNEASVSDEEISSGELTADAETTFSEAEEPEFATETEAAELTSLSDTVYIDGGKCGENSTWALSESGILTVSGTGDSDFYLADKTPVKKLIVKEGITSVGYSDYAGCINLTSVSLPKTLKKIENFCFAGCTALTSVVIPDNVTEIDPCAFSGCISLSSVKLGKKLTVLNGGIFENCTSLSEITLPASLTTIEFKVFKNCQSLKKIKIPDNVKNISTEIFLNCSSLESVTLGKNIKEISYRMFEGCQSLTSINITDNITSIGAAAFMRCSSLRSLTLGNSVSSLGNKAFKDCSSLRELYFRGNAPTFSNTAFETLSADAYYPAGDATWQPYNMTLHGGVSIRYQTWVPYPVIAGVSNTTSGPKVSWKASSGAAGYYIYRSTNGGAFQLVKKTGALSWTDTNAKTNGGKYQYRICAFNGQNKSEFSSVKTTYYLTAPAAPKLANTAARRLNISWAKNSKATGYQVQYATNSKFSGAKTVTISSVSTIKKTLTGLTKNKKYYVRVRSVKDVLGAKYYSPWGSIRSLTVKK